MLQLPGSFHARQAFFQNDHRLFMALFMICWRTVK